MPYLSKSGKPMGYGKGSMKNYKGSRKNGGGQSGYKGSKKNMGASYNEEMLSPSMYRRGGI